MITAMPRIAIAVEDFSATLETFREQLGMPIVDVSERTMESLGAKVAMCVPEGGSNIELMSPGVPEAPLSRSLQKFLDQRGDGLFALMLEAPDPNAEADELLGRGLDVLPLMDGAGGRDVHPRSTHGVLIRVYPDDSFTGTTEEVSGEPGLSGIQRGIIAVFDAARAADTYRDGFGLEVGEATLDEEGGVMRAICTPPKGGRIELVSVVDRERPFASRIACHLDGGREGLYGLVLTSPDPEAAADLLETRGMDVDRSCGLETQAFGARLRIEAG